MPKENKKITIIEVLSKEVEIKENETMDDIKKKYYDGDIVLYPDNYLERTFFVEDEERTKINRILDLLFELEE